MLTNVSISCVAVRPRGNYIAAIILNGYGFALLSFACHRSCFVNLRFPALVYFASVTRFVNSPRLLTLPLLINKTSPLAGKTTGATVVFILAPHSGVRFPYLGTKKDRPKPVLLTGGAEGNRTPDLLNAIQTLSQLSYNPITIFLA